MHGRSAQQQRFLIFFGFGDRMIPRPPMKGQGIGYEMTFTPRRERR